MMQWLYILVPIFLTLIVSVISFFLKRSFERIDQLEKEIDKIKENYLTKDDFFRELSKLERNNKDIMALLIEIKGKVG